MTDTTETHYSEFERAMAALLKRWLGRRVRVGLGLYGHTGPAGTHMVASGFVVGVHEDVLTFEDAPMASGQTVAEVFLSRVAFESATLVEGDGGAELRMSFGDVTVSVADV